MHTQNANQLDARQVAPMGLFGKIFAKMGHHDEDFAILLALSVP